MMLSRRGYGDLDLILETKETRTVVIFVCSEETIEGTAIELDDINKVSHIRGKANFRGPNEPETLAPTADEVGTDTENLTPRPRIRGIPQILPAFVSSYMKTSLWANNALFLVWLIKQCGTKKGCAIARPDLVGQAQG